MAMMRALAVLLLVARLSFTFAAFDPVPLVPMPAPLHTAGTQNELVDLGSQAACVASASETGADKDHHGQCVHFKLCNPQSMLVTQSCAGGTVCCWKLLKQHDKHGPAPPTSNGNKDQAESKRDAGDNAPGQEQAQQGASSKPSPSKSTQEPQPQPQQRSADNPSNNNGGNGGQKPGPSSGSKDTSHHGKNGNQHPDTSHHGKNGNQQPDTSHHGKNGNQEPDTSHHGKAGNGNDGKPAPSSNGNGANSKQASSKDSKESAGSKAQPQQSKQSPQSQQGQQKPEPVATEPIPGTSNPDKAGPPVKSHTPKGPHHDSQVPKPEPQGQPQPQTKVGAQGSQQNKAASPQPQAQPKVAAASQHKTKPGPKR